MDHDNGKHPLMMATAFVSHIHGEPEERAGRQQNQAHQRATDAQGTVACAREQRSQRCC